MALREVAVAVLEDAEGRVLMAQRPAHKPLPMLWEFPGGKVELGESDSEALVREMNERLGVLVEVGELVSAQPHAYELYTVELHIYACRIIAGEPAPRAVHAFRWATSAEFDAYPFTPADEASMSRLLGVIDA